ncbi:MAG: histidine--tRNA ligase [Flavobacterium sp.]
MAQKPSLAKGTRDFSSEEVFKRNYIIQIIQKHFQRFGFAPIETPSFENSETLLGKYGEEGDRLIFKILNSGDFLAKADTTFLQEKNSTKIASQITEKALRYDLTVPFARYVVMHQNELVFPFKRYQIQPVWRADRPQKGRFREFYQCDADVIGSTSLLQEVELLQLYDAVFTDLGLHGVALKMNNRKILSGFAEIMQAQEQLIDFTVALDKLDKIGEEAVKQEMLDKGISAEAIDKIQPLFSFSGSNTDKLNTLKELLSTSTIGMQGVAEMEFLIETIQKIGLQTAQLQIEVTLARGLNYYTGTILEVAAPQVQMGSIGGGGRYDDLTGIFGLKNMSGVGISFGLDRIYLVLEELGLFPDSVQNSLEVLFIQDGQTPLILVLKTIQQLRKKGVVVELYPDATKSDKQFKYAERKNVTWLVRKASAEQLEVKNLKTNEVETLVWNDFLSKF